MVTADTSVVIRALLRGMTGHADAARAIDGHDRPVDHVLLESYSVLTRAPGIRLPAADAVEALRALLPGRVFSLPASARARIAGELASAGVAGGATYDGLIAATAAHHGAVLLTADRRAARTYAALGARFELLG